MKERVLLLTSLGLMLFSCKQEDTPKVKYENEVDSLRFEYQKIDTTELKISDLPIHFKQMDYIMHPIGKIRVKTSGNKYSGTSSEISYSISSYNEPEITGMLNNILFQKLDATEMLPLTDRKMLIQSITFLDQLALNSNKKYLLYNVYDIDTNKDEKYDTNDIKSLYISLQDGSNFQKLSLDMQEVLDWKVLEAKNRLYFRTIEDINKNGEFDSKDNLNYFYVDLLNDSLTVEKYLPL